MKNCVFTIVDYQKLCVTYMIPHHSSPFSLEYTHAVRNITPTVVEIFTTSGEYPQAFYSMHEAEACLRKFMAEEIPRLEKQIEYLEENPMDTNKAFLKILKERLAEIQRKLDDFDLMGGARYEDFVLLR